ncbi:MAG: outer membrane lipoprotein-sorting protein [Pseudomonadota bacterium]
MGVYLPSPASGGGAGGEGAFVLLPTLLLLLATLLLAALLSPPALAAPDPQTLLKDADTARGGGLPGIVWQISLVSRDGDKTPDEQRLEVRAVDDASVAETLEPARFKGSKLLQVGRNMWLTRPGLSKPIPISPRQRMSGQASNGDIAATNYAKDYDATLAGEADLEGEACYLLELRAKHKRTTYDQVRYWVSRQRQVGLKAEFRSLSGKLLKTATFTYGNRITYQGKTRPFVSRMVIRDALTDAETTMDYGAVSVRPLPAAEFDLGQMQ